jgi:hypothetical protein
LSGKPHFLWFSINNQTYVIIFPLPLASF